MTDWSPRQYLLFDDERGRPAVDLLARVPLDHPARVVDLGCGPGNSTELLQARYPGAAVVGLDSSPAMIEAARERVPEATFVEGTIEAWNPELPFDLIYANASMQWVPDHLAVMTRLLDGMPAGGVLAVQVPDNLEEPTHRLMRVAAEQGPWSERFAGHVPRQAIPTPNAYYDALGPMAASVDIWHTVYYHLMAGPGAIVEWLKGTGLRPYLAQLGADDHEAYLADYEARIADAHPALFDGKVILRFPRLFVVVVRA